VLILLPPSEGKRSPVRGRPLDLARLRFPDLAAARAAVLDELVSRCRDTPEEMLAVLGLSAGQAEEVTRNTMLEDAPTARADTVYTGVLYDALGLPDLDAAARRLATRRVLIFSALFGVVGPADRIPAYRLSGQVRLPDLGGVARHWSRHLATPMHEAAGDGLVVDLRSGAYTPFWRPARDRAGRVATVRVLHEQDGRRSVVSHFNKATKGRIVRALLQDGGTPRHPRSLAEQLQDLGWQVEQQDGHLDVVVTTLT
jgi:cytoplasmic iron level regulating protein YaaA (DUF328/UPF0246 family)